MKTCRLNLLAACLLSILSAGALAQGAAAAAGVKPAASAPLPKPNPKPRLLSPAEKRESATLPGELRPEGPATPQINIPLGQTPPPPPARKPSRTARGGVDDAVARCGAIVDEHERANCRDQLARQAPRR